MYKRQPNITKVCKQILSYFSNLKPMGKRQIVCSKNLQDKKKTHDIKREIFKRTKHVMFQVKHAVIRRTIFLNGV